MSNFDPNAILRGAQLTLVGCTLCTIYPTRSSLTGSQYTAPSKIQASSPRATTVKLPLPSLLESLSAFSSPSPYVTLHECRGHILERDRARAVHLRSSTSWTH